MVTEDQVRAAMSEIYDPCSVASGSSLSIEEMGLVTAVDVDARGDVRVMLRPTSMMCTLINAIMDAVHDRVSLIPGVRSVDLGIDRDHPWTENELSEEGKRKLAEVRSRSRAAVPVRRQQWKEQGPV